jgi:hypothetical protein
MISPLGLALFIGKYAKPFVKGRSPDTVIILQKNR